MKNIWKNIGVSLIPSNLADWMPLVGQKELFAKLKQFKTEAVNKSADALAGFFVLVGGWGLGKSSIGHETVLEVIDPEIEWIIDGQGQRIMDASLKDGLLALFVRYSQATEGPIPLSTESWIPALVYQALNRLLNSAETGGSNLKRNQDRLYDHVITMLRPKGVDGIKEQLAAYLKDMEENAKYLTPTAITRTTQKALDILKTIGVERLWIVVDEIEDISDVEREGLPDDDRKGIDQASLTVIGGVIKQEEVRQEYPEVNFLLLCARSVGDMLRDIKALDRRTGFYELKNNSFADVQAYFDYLKNNRPDLYLGLERYPAGIKEAAFFAANRNFGWFNVIMYYCHENIRDGSVPVPELLKMFATNDSRAERSVFDIQALSDYHISPGSYKNELVSLIYGQLPKRVGTDLTPETAGNFMQINHVGTDQPVCAELVEILPPSEADIMSYMITAGFKNTGGNVLNLAGEGSFDLGEVINCLRSYSIGLPEGSRNHLLIFTELEEFIEQIRGLTPYEQEASFIATPLHKLLMEEAYRFEEKGKECRYIAPSFRFMLRFNRLNKRAQAETGYLKDAGKNTRLEEAYNAIKFKPQDKDFLLLKGFAQNWEDRVVDGYTDADLVVPNYIFTSSRSPLNIGNQQRVTLLHATTTDNVSLDVCLRKLAALPAHPIVVLMEGTAEKEGELHQVILRNSLAPMVIVRNFSGYHSEILVRFGMMGSVFAEDDLRTSYFNSTLTLLRQQFLQVIEGQDNSWRKEIERRGMILRPILYKKTGVSEEIKIMALGYARMQGGKSFAEVIQETDTTLDEGQKADFKRAVKNHIDLPSKYALCRTLEIFIDYQTTIPRSLIAVLNRMGETQCSPANLERMFLFDADDFKPIEVLRQIFTFLEALGFIRPEGNDKYRRVNTKTWKDEVEVALAWLNNGEFHRQLTSIQAISKPWADNLLQIRLPEAKSKLKRAKDQLALLDLAYIDWEQGRLMTVDLRNNRFQYDIKFSEAVVILCKVKDCLAQTYQSEEVRSFVHSVDLLVGHEQESKNDSYPLWRRVLILQNFCAQLAEKRAELTPFIDEKIDHNDRLVPTGSDGQKVFPTQVLSVPLRQIRAELNFPADVPVGIISGTSSALPKTIGFKISTDKLADAVKRLHELDGELKDPGKLVNRYFVCLQQWQELSQQIKRLKNELTSWQAFFADAPDKIQKEFKLAELTIELSYLEGQILDGGMRVGTDEREGAKTSQANLLIGLEKDIQQAKTAPFNLEQTLSSMGSSIILYLQEKYQKDNQQLLAAVGRLQKIQGQPPLAFSDKLSSSYRETEAAFEQVIAVADKIGQKFFAKAEHVKWADYQALCKQTMNKQEIHWLEEPYCSFADELQSLGLLKMTLV